jgi:hypothetical protein
MNFRNRPKPDIRQAEKRYGVRPKKTTYALSVLKTIRLCALYFDT